ncbi:hypothetical protein [Bacillus toyonensis]|uniref:hypothetical protein n=1 Tax=Bacillus toyonensis TaxID=155322 RepID=UPI0032F7BCD6|nr:hypothetical protein [Bacillus toyonensis]
MKKKKIMSLVFTASLLLGGAIPSYAEENPDNGFEPIPFENVESNIVLNGGLDGIPTAGFPVYCQGLSSLYLGSNEVIGQSISVASSNIALIGVTGFTYKDGKYVSSNTTAKNNSRNVSITNKAPYSSGSTYKQDTTHKYVAYDGQTAITGSYRYETF